MHSILIIFPGFMLSLSLFHFTVVLHRFQTGFDLLTPSVIQRYLSYEIDENTLEFWLDPSTISPGIQDYFASQFADEQTTYQLEFVFFNADQSSICLTRCHGVLTTLDIQFQWSTISFSRHYQLVKQ